MMYMDFEKFFQFYNKTVYKINLESKSNCPMSDCISRDFFEENICKHICLLAEKLNYFSIPNKCKEVEIAPKKGASRFGERKGLNSSIILNKFCNI